MDKMTSSDDELKMYEILDSLKLQLSDHHQIIFSNILDRIEVLERKVKKYLYDRPYKCPCCDGKSIKDEVKCTSCNGTGIIWK